MTPSLASLFRTEYSLETFIGTALYAGGVWPSPRHGDGILECNEAPRPGGLRMNGRLYTIDQRRHVFSLELRDGVRLRWTLCLGGDAPTPRKPRKPRRGRPDVVVELLEDGPWHVILAGHVELDGDVPVPVIDPVADER